MRLAASAVACARLRLTLAMWWASVTDLQGPSSERTRTEKIRDLKSLARQYARDQGSCDDVRISYLEDLEDRDSDNLRLAQMLAM
jgi:hypothetical protein